MQDKNTNEANRIFKSAGHSRRLHSNLASPLTNFIGCIFLGARSKGDSHLQTHSCFDRFIYCGARSLGGVKPFNSVLQQLSRADQATIKLRITERER
jgi:hypothetical protein